MKIVCLKELFDVKKFRPSYEQKRKFKRLDQYNLDYWKWYLAAIEHISGKKIEDLTVLDLGCGAKRNSPPTAYRKEDEGKGVFDSFQPYLCRAIHLMGGRAIGIDFGNLSDEPFEHYKKDLTETNCLDNFASDSVDVAVERAFFSSPSLIYHNFITKSLLPQVDRIVKPNGFFLYEDIGSFVYQAILTSEVIQRFSQRYNSGDKK